MPQVGHKEVVYTENIWNIINHKNNFTMNQGLTTGTKKKKKIHSSERIMCLTSEKPEISGEKTR